MPLRSLTPSPTSSAMSETKKRTHVKLLYPTPVELRASVGKVGQQPARTQAAAANYNGGSVVHLDLVFSGGRAALPEDIFDALEAKYGSGKVVTDRDALTPGVLQMRILP
jgi:hypothetical protein